MKYEFLFPEAVDSEQVNKALFALFGSIDVDIDWRNDRTVWVQTGGVVIYGPLDQ